jgi:hypothetical protein
VEQQKDGAYHLKIVGTIDPVIKTLARHSVLRLEVEEAPLEEVFLKFYTDGADDLPPAAQPVIPSAAKEG